MLGFRKFLTGINIIPKATSTVNTQGDIDITSGDGKINYYNGTSASPLVTEAHASTLTNKTIAAGSNTITGLTDSNLASGASISLSKLTALTVSRAVQTNSSTGFLEASAVTNTELNYLSGVTSAIQTQFTGKLSTGGGTVTGTIDMGSNKITTTYSPTNAADLTNKTYVDNLVAGLTWKNAARVASTANVNISSAPATIDSVTLTVGDRILLKNQTTGSENGIYTFPGTGGTLIRSTDMDTWSEVVGAVLLVVEGSTNSGSKWVNTNVTGGTIGTTPVTFTTFSVSGTINGTGTASQVAYFSGTSTLASEAQLSPLRGGLGADASAFTGLLKFSAGTASASTLVNADVSASAAIALSKLASLTVSRALQSNASTGVIEVSAVTNTELGYLSGVTSAIQTQFTGKQPLATNLTSLAAYNTNGFLVQTAAGTFAGRSIAVGSGRLSVSNGDGVAANPSLDVVEANLGLNNIGGTLSITKGGTNSTTALNNNRIMVSSGSAIVEAAALTNGQLLIGSTGAAPVAAALTQGSGITITNGAGSITIAATAQGTTGDIQDTLFSAANTTSTPTNVTGFAFANGSIRSFRAQVSVVVNATTSLYEHFDIMGIQKGASWELSTSSVGDNSGFTFSITTAGQVQYTNGTYAGFVSAPVHFRALVTLT